MLCSVRQEAAPCTACFPGCLASWLPLGDPIRRLERGEGRGEKLRASSFSSVSGGFSKRDGSSLVPAVGGTRQVAPPARGL